MLLRLDYEVEAKGSAWEPGKVLGLRRLKQFVVSFYWACGE
jgi:hypothetical protein